MVGISDRLRLVRTQLGHTQKEMAGVLGVAYRTLQDNERALVQPGAATLSAYAAIGVDLNWLITGLEHPQRASLAPPVDELRIKKNSVVELRAYSNDGSGAIERRTGHDDGFEMISLELLPKRNRGSGKLDGLVYVTQPDGSMAPVIPKGAKLIVDIGSKFQSKTEIYLLRIGGRLVARHVEETKDGYIIITTAQGNVEAVYPATERASIGLLGLIRYIILSV